MRLSRTSEFRFGWLCVVPLIDVLFLLLFFFLLSSNFVLQPGISLTVPFSSFTLAPQLNQEIISISGGAAPAIYFRDQKVTLQELGPMLEKTRGEGRPVVIRADRFTPYNEVVQVMNAVLERGISSVSLATTPQK